MKIILKDSRGKYKHLVTFMPHHILIKKQISDTFEQGVDAKGIELQSTLDAKQGLLMNCLKHVQSEVNEQLNSEYFNVVRILTVIDDLASEFTKAFQNELSRAFASESIRYLLTQYDMTEKTLYTSLDYGRLDLYPAYPVPEGRQQSVERDAICKAADVMGVRVDKYPYNYEFLKFGTFTLLKQALYPDLDLHNAGFYEQEKYIMDTQKVRQAAFLAGDAPDNPTRSIFKIT